MTGLDKIIQEIESDAQSRCREISENAKLKCDEITEAAKKEALAITEKGKEDAKIQSGFISERGISAKELDRRKKILNAKQEIISSVLDAALDKLTGLPDKEYFDVIFKLIKNKATGQTGEIAFGEKDLNRLPDDFEARLSEVSSKLSLCRTPHKTDSGFVLVYGGIEENCSFKAMIDSRSDELRDFIKKMLFD